MKNLANCTPTEFLKQTSKIKRSAEKWLKVTDIMAIRKRVPANLPEINKSAPVADQGEVIAKRAEMLREQAYKNFSIILDAMLEDHPEETLELLAHCCFVDPEKVDDYPMGYYLAAVTEMLSDESVKGFFITLMSLVQ